jgi:DNA adenine methylase
MTSGATIPKAYPLVPWPGGKRAMLKYLLPLVPADAICHVEVFGGCAAMLLALEKRAGCLEVYNDTHSDLVNLFRQAKHHAEALVAELQFMPNSREEFQLRRAPAAGLTEIQRAARFFNDAANGFGGGGKEFGTSAISGSAAHTSCTNKMANVRAFAMRFDSVCIEQKDWRDILRIYDRPSTFFYMDPPYIDAPTKRYSGWKEADATEFAAAIGGLQGRWIVSMGDTPLAREIFAGFRCLYFDRQNKIDSKNLRRLNPIYKEMVVVSPGITLPETQ